MGSSRGIGLSTMAHTGSVDRLKVFISSKMTELRDVRELVGRTLKNHGVHAWVYEAQIGARPETVEETSVRNVYDWDIFIGLFGAKYGAVTIQEYQRARELNKPGWGDAREAVSARAAVVTVVRETMRPRRYPHPPPLPTQSLACSFFELRAPNKT